MRPDKLSLRPKDIWWYRCSLVKILSLDLYVQRSTGIRSRMTLIKYTNAHTDLIVGSPHVSTTHFRMALRIGKVVQMCFLLVCYYGSNYKLTRYAIYAMFTSAINRVYALCELQRQKMYLPTCAPSADSDQPLHSHSLIRIFTVRTWIVKDANLYV